MCVCVCVCGCVCERSCALLPHASVYMCTRECSPIKMQCSVCRGLLFRSSTIQGPPVRFVHEVGAVFWHNGVSQLLLPSGLVYQCPDKSVRVTALRDNGEGEGGSILRVKTRRVYPTETRVLF